LTEFFYDIFKNN